MANLWDVTDRDIDKVTVALLEAWIARPELPACALLPEARLAAKLKHLNGAAPVCYGVPLSLAQICMGRELRTSV